MERIKSNGATQVKVNPNFSYSREFKCVQMGENVQWVQCPIRMINCQRWWSRVHVFTPSPSPAPIITSISQSTEEWMKRSNPTGNVSLIRVFDKSKPAVAVAKVIRTNLTMFSMELISATPLPSRRPADDCF